MRTDPRHQAQVLKCRWRTPAGVWRAPLRLLGREAYDLDAASEDAADITVATRRRLTPAQNALTCQWFPAEQGMSGPASKRPLVWLNPPFGAVMGSLKSWSQTARAWATRGAVVAFYAPVFGDRWGDELEAAALTTIRVGGGRVRHLPPSGLQASSPQQHAHRIWMLGSADLASTWPYAPRAVWDWRREVFTAPKLGSQK